MTPLAARMRVLSWKKINHIDILRKEIKPKKEKLNSHTDNDNRDDIVSTLPEHDGKKEARHEKSALYYKEDSYDINSPLRNNINVDKHRKKVIGDLDKLTTHHKLKRATSLYRGVHSSIKELPIGSIITDHGFTGTSTDEEIAKKFGVTITPKAKLVKYHIVHIKAAKGTMGLHYHTFNKKAGLPESPNKPSHDYEDEFLLPRGSKFRVIGNTVHKIKHPNNDKPRTVYTTHMELVHIKKRV